jgi:hypothetical protein
MCVCAPRVVSLLPEVWLTESGFAVANWSESYETLSAVRKAASVLLHEYLARAGVSHGGFFVFLQMRSRALQRITLWNGIRSPH